MAHARVALAAPLAVVLGCGGAAPAPASAADPRPVNEAPATFQGTRWGTYHSKRFELSLGLPDGSAWKIDDHRSAWLRASHEPTHSSLALRSWSEDTNVTKKACYARAREWDERLPDIDSGPLVDDGVRPLLGNKEARVAVGVGVREGSDPATIGFVVAIVGEIKRCVLIAFQTEASGASAQDEVADRLAIATDRLLPAMKLDPTFAPVRERPIVQPAGGAGGGR